ncbi:hypothetical protein [Salinispora oceanensis]|uniref:hypothetical protein n=1 Tax=Salinispora oceanensis TaxID=1050199 RepID=UPI00037941D4|nr:hypothetical protein [Salinispora oceanensis]
MTEHHDVATRRATDAYVAAEIHRLLAEDPDVAEQGITVVRRELGLVLHGEVESAQRRDEILRRVAEHFPELAVTSDIGVIRAHPPTEIEQLP